MVIQNANIKIQPVLTKEQIAYEEALKNLKSATARLKISQEGVNIDDISQEKLEIATKLYDEMDMIQRDFNIESQKVQQDVNNRMSKLQEDANKKFGDVQKRYRELIGSMKGGEYSSQIDGTNMSKEKEESLRKMLEEELKNAQDIIAE
jgi:hypothetical protein